MRLSELMRRLALLVAALGFVGCGDCLEPGRYSVTESSYQSTCTGTAAHNQHQYATQVPAGKVCDGTKIGSTIAEHFSRAEQCTRRTTLDDSEGAIVVSKCKVDRGGLGGKCMYEYTAFYRPL